MSELFAWVPWFQALARKITDNDADYFVPRARKVLSSAVGPKAPAVHEVRNTGKQLEVFALDLAAEPAGLLEQINALAGRVRAKASQARVVRAA